MTTLFTKDDCGCYAECGNGEDHRRSVLADTLREICIDAMTIGSEEYNTAFTIHNDLLKPSSEDYSEEDDAIDILNDYTEKGIYWEMVDGDLMLNPLSLCDHCDCVRINGLICHEHGCPNRNRELEKG